MPLSEFLIEASPGEAYILVDGRDVSSHVVGYQLSHEGRDAPPKLVLVTYNRGVIKGQGVVEVHVLDDRLIAMLGSVNPAELEAEALQRLEWGSPGGVVHQALEILKERLANADQPEGSPGSG